METVSPTLKIYIFGHLAQPLLVLAEFQGARALERLKLRKQRIQALVRMIRDLRAFIEAGYPTFEEAGLQQLGAELFDLIINGKVKALLNRATGANRSLRPLEIYVEDYDIAGWPWEFLYDSSSSVFICQELNPISRGIFSMSAPEILAPIKRKIKILLATGILPTDSAATPSEEIRWIKEVFKSRLATGDVEITVMQAAEPKDLLIALNQSKYDVVHFFGHAGFDLKKSQGYLKLERQSTDAYKFYANDFAQLLAHRNIRLVFLNGCETGRSAQESDPARSSLAAAVLDRGVPAVIATQFSITDTSAHYLSSVIYDCLLSGKPLMGALSDGRRAMAYAAKSQFCDWGIPVLYTSNPDLVIFPLRTDRPKAAWIAPFDDAVKGPNVLSKLATLAPGAGPSVKVQRTLESRKKTRPAIRVALIDLDSKAGFLPDIVTSANNQQAYYHFEVAYLPLPSGAIRKDFEGGHPQLLLNVLQDYLKNKPKELRVDFVCCLTNCMIAVKVGVDKFAWNLFASELPKTSGIFAISSFDLRRYSRESGVPFAKIVLCLCLSMLLAEDPRWELDYHIETAGCLLDYCERRDDILVGLQKMRFNHAACRNRIKDPDQLKAIDSLIAL